MPKFLISYKDAVYEILKINIDKFNFPNSKVFQVTIDVIEFKNRKNRFSEINIMYLVKEYMTKEQLIARTLYKNTLETADFYI